MPLLKRGVSCTEQGNFAGATSFHNCHPQEFYAIPPGGGVFSPDVVLSYRQKSLLEENEVSETSGGRGKIHPLPPYSIQQPSSCQKIVETREIILLLTAVMLLDTLADDKSLPCGKPPWSNSFRSDFCHGRILLLLSSLPFRKIELFAAWAARGPGTRNGSTPAKPS